MQYIIDPERISALGGADLANPYARFTPAISVSAEDFSFQNSFDSLKGQTESLSVAGMTGSIDTIDKAIPGRDRDDKKDKDGIGWDDVVEAGERLQEEKRRLSVGAISFTADEVDAIRSIANDPEKLARANQALQDKGYTQEQADFGMHWAMIAAEIAFKEEHGIPLTAEEEAQKQELEEMTPEETAVIQEAGSTMAQIGRANELTIGANVRSQDRANTQGDEQTVVANANTGNIANDDAVAANIDDEGVWLATREAQGFDSEEVGELSDWGSGESSALAFSDERSGPIVTPDFNSTAAGAPQLAQAQTPTEPRQPAASEIGLG